MTTSVSTFEQIVAAGRVQFAKGADVASASALSPGSDGNYFDVTGTTAITSIATLGVGTTIRLHFDGVLTLTHHATDLILPGGANITTAAGDEAEFVEYASGDWRCVSYQKADGSSVVSAGLTEWTEANATPVSNEITSFAPSSASTNVAAALVPKGTGALIAAIPDGTSAGGNDRGANAVDLQASRSAASQVASGSGAVLLGGSGNTASGTQSAVVGGLSNTASGNQSGVASGYINTASGNQSVVVGGFQCTSSGHRSVASGYQSTASGQEARAHGNNCTASGYYTDASGWYATTRNIIGTQARASGRFSATGDAQCSAYQLRAATTDATQTALTADAGAAGTTNIPVLPNNHCYRFTAEVVGWDSSGSNVAAYTITGVIKRGANASATSLVTSSVTVEHEDVAGWDCDAAADTTNGGLLIRATGAASTNIHWLAEVRTQEVG